MKAYLPIFPTKAECETRFFLCGDPYPYVCIWAKDRYCPVSATTVTLALILHRTHLFYFNEEGVTRGFE